MDALTNPETIAAWGAGPNVVMDANVGTEFSLWDGDIYGKNIEVVENQLLEQEWYGGDWDKPSIVTFTLKSKDDSTVVTLKHSNFPEQVDQAAFDSFVEGWNDYYMGPITELLEGN